MKKTGFLLTLLGLSVCLCITVSAEGTGKSYVYDHNQKARQVPDPYNVEQVLDAGQYPWSHPVDVLGRDEFIYVLDGAGRIVVLNADTYALEREFSFTKDGQPYETIELKSFWIDQDGTFLVVDRSKKVVFRTLADGSVIQEYGKPETDLIDDTSDYLPCQVLTDPLGKVYIMAENQYRGIFKLTREGEFITFYGSKNVNITASLLLDMLWRNFMTDAQISNSRRYLPTEYNSMAIDEDGFIYTTSLSSSERKEWVAKLNSLGSNVLRSDGKFGDFDLGRMHGRWYTTNFSSITVDNEGYITVLDKTWNRLFQYTQEGDLLYAFGGKGEQEGTFGEPANVRAIGDRLLVCDTLYGTVTVWMPSEFGAIVRKADGLYQAGLFAESEASWKAVLCLCQNYEYAYNGLGKAAYIQKDYKQALRYFRLGYDREDYSLAFARYRAAALRQAFLSAAVVLLLGLIGIALAIRLYRRYRQPIPEGPPKLPYLRYLRYILFHPIDGFQELRYNHLGSARLASGIMLLFFFVSCLDFTERGFIFNTNEPGSFNVWVILATTVVTAFAFCLVNWLLSTFFDGKGNLKDVWTVVGYSLVPTVLCQLLQLILSQFLTLEEGAFLGYIAVVGVLWSGIVFVFGLQEVHQYSFGRNIASLLVSVIGILILLFLLFLMGNLFIQVSDFVKTVMEELLYRARAGF